MSEMYPPPQPNNQDPRYPNTTSGQNPPPPGGAWTQPFQPQQPMVGVAPSQPPAGYPGYPGGYAPVPPAYVRTNVAEYWKNARNGKRNLSILAAAFVIFLLMGSAIGSAGGTNAGVSSNPATTNETSGHTTDTAQSTGTAQPTTPPAPTATSAPQESAAQYKASATSVSVSDVSKNPNGYKGQTVEFTAVIANFVQDSSGNTAGANVDDPNDYSSVIQIAFTPSFDISKVNKGDTIEVWGQGLGSFSGTNAYGATITEGAVQEVYLVDSTTGYKDNSITDPASFTAN